MANYVSSYTGAQIDTVIGNALLRSEAQTTYLTQANANTNFLKITDADSIYLKKIDKPKIFVNYSNCIWSQATNADLTSTTFVPIYTPSQDCFFVFLLRKPSGSYDAWIQISGGPEMHYLVCNNAATGNTTTWYLKQGQTFYAKVEGGTFIYRAWAYALQE